MTQLKFLGLASVCLGAMLATGAQSSPAASEEQARQAVEARQNTFKEMESAFKPVGAMLKKPREPFDAAVVQRSATRIEELSKTLPELFEVDTSKFPIKTEARSGIWSSMPDFRAKADAMVKAAAAMNAAAQSGDQGAMRKSAIEVGKTCGACHDSFRDKS